jgi:hypothetical protein
MGWWRGLDSVEELQAEMQVELPPRVVAALREERERHFAGQLDEPAAKVRSRWLRLRGVELRRHLEAVRPFLGPRLDE